MNILIADDHGLFRAGIEGVLVRLDADTRIDHAATLDEAKAAAAAGAFDLVLLDLFMPGMDGAAGIAQLRAIAPATPIVVVSASEAATDARAAIAAGAAGYIAKSVSPDRFLDTLRRIVETGETGIAGVELEPAQRPAHLTTRQTEILRLAATGLSNREIGLQLGITEGTVKIHMSSALKTLGARNRTEAARLLQEATY